MPLGRSFRVWRFRVGDEGLEMYIGNYHVAFGVGVLGFGGLGLRVADKGSGMFRVSAQV